MERNDRNFGVKNNYSDGRDSGSEQKPYNRDNRNSSDRPYNRDNRGPSDRPYNRDNRPYNRDAQGDSGSRENRPYNRDSGSSDRPYNRDNRNPSDRPYNRDNRGGPSRGGKFSKPSKTPARQKTETQEFLEYKDEKIETIFPVPAGAKLPEFQRAIGIARGTVKDVNMKGSGTIVINGFDYPLKENRNNFWEKKAPLTKFLEKEISFTFYPTITMKGIKMLNLTPESPPFIKVANLRKELPKENYVEILGRIKYITDKWMLIGIYSAIQKKEYVIYVFGKSDAKKDDFVKADCSLENGVIKLDSIRVFA